MQTHLNPGIIVLVFMTQQVSLYVFLGCLLLSSCGRINKSKNIIKSWEVTQIQINNPDTSATKSIHLCYSSPAKIVYQFREDGSYTIDDSFQVDEGKWLITEDQKVLMLTSNKHKADNAEFIIESFHSGQMIISTDEGGIREYITLKAMN